MRAVDHLVQDHNFSVVFQSQGLRLDSLGDSFEEMPAGQVSRCRSGFQVGVLSPEATAAAGYNAIFFQPGVHPVMQLLPAPCDGARPAP